METVFYIKSLELTHVRGLPPIKLDLTRPDGSFAGMTVIAGRNGSGKTSLLQALAIAFYQDSLRPPKPSEWICLGENSCRIDLKFHFEGENGLDPNQMYEHFLELHRSGLENSGGITTLPDFFLVGYGPLRRLYDETAFFETRDKRSMEDRVITLLNHGASLGAGIPWLKDLHLQAFEKQDGAAETRDAIFALLRDGLFPDDIYLEGISSKGLHFTQTKGDQTLELILDQLSDGYRCLVAMVIDILRQLQLAFGKLTLSHEAGTVCVAHAGVVLIDELDAHLHVSWQQKFGFWLKAHFPKIQFIVTTHSPFICQAADLNGLLCLSPEKGLCSLQGEDYYNVVNGSVDDAMVDQLFGLDFTHSAASEDLRNELAELDVKLLRNRISSEERVRRKVLVGQMPQGPSAESSRVLRELREKLS